MTVLELRNICTADHGHLLSLTAQWFASGERARDYECSDTEALEVTRYAAKRLITFAMGAGHEVYPTQSLGISAKHDGFMAVGKRFFGIAGEEMNPLLR